jgi:hypothetical protein
MLGAALIYAAQPTRSAQSLCSAGIRLADSRSVDARLCGRRRVRGAAAALGTVRRLRRGQELATAAHEEMQSWWDETRSNVHDRFEVLRANRMSTAPNETCKWLKTALTTPSWMPRTRLISPPTRSMKPKTPWSTQSSLEPMPAISRCSTVERAACPALGEGGRVPRYLSRGTTGGAPVRSKAAENR